MTTKELTWKYGEALSNAISSRGIDVVALAKALSVSPEKLAQWQKGLLFPSSKHWVSLKKLELDPSTLLDAHAADPKVVDIAVCTEISSDQRLIRAVFLRVKDALRLKFIVQTNAYRAIGIGPGSIARWIRGTAYPNFSQRHRLAQYDINLAAILEEAKKELRAHPEATSGVAGKSELEGLRLPDLSSGKILLAVMTAQHVSISMLASLLSVSLEEVFSWILLDEIPEKYDVAVRTFGLDRRAILVARSEARRGESTWDFAFRKRRARVLELVVRKRYGTLAEAGRVFGIAKALVSKWCQGYTFPSDVSAETIKKKGLDLVEVCEIAKKLVGETFESNQKLLESDLGQLHLNRALSKVNSNGTSAFPRQTDPILERLEQEAIASFTNSVEAASQAIAAETALIQGRERLQRLAAEAEARARAPQRVRKLPNLHREKRVDDPTIFNF